MYFWKNLSLMKLPLLLVLSFYVSLQALAQSDTTYIYLNNKEHICHSDTATFVKLFYKKDNLWYSEKYSNNTRYILEETTFSDDSGNIKQIVEHKEFASEGVLYKRLTFVRGVVKNGFYYYPSGAIRGVADFNSTGEIIKQSGFDENGGEIRNYYFEKQPELITGTEWRIFAAENLRKRVIHKNKAPNGNYKLKLLFDVNEDGTISNLTTDKDPGYGIKEEALRLFSHAGKWQAGYMNGKKVRMRTHLTLAFTLDDTKVGY